MRLLLASRYQGRERERESSFEGNGEGEAYPKKQFERERERTEKQFLEENCIPVLQIYPFTDTC